MTNSDSAFVFETGGAIENNECVFAIDLGKPVGSGQPIRTKSYKAIVDTGATSTCLHPDIVNELELVAIDKQTVVLADGSEVPCDVVGVLLRLRDPSTKETYEQFVEALVPDASTGELLLGMDFLQIGVLTLDGPRRQWSWRLPKQEVHVRGS